MDTELLLKNFAEELKGAATQLQESLRLIQSGRPSIELVGDLKVSYFDQWFAVKQLGTLAVFPPRGVQITVWDKGTIGPITKAIEDAKVGLTVSTEGLTIRASLSALSNDRREELTRAVKKEVEGVRIRVRALRDEANRKVKAAETESQMSKDVAFKTRERLQKNVDEANRSLEMALNAKLTELGSS